MSSKFISIRGAREHNLKNIDLDLPRDRRPLSILVEDRWRAPPRLVALACRIAPSFMQQIGRAGR